MTLINALPFDGVSISSETWRQFQRHILQPMGSSTLNDGIYYTPWTGQFKVTRASATQITVQSGSGMANGLPFWSTSAISLPVAAAHATYTRYDLVVVRVNFIDKEARVTILQGTPAASPVAPALQKSAAPYYDVPLARLTVAPGSGVTEVVDFRDFISGASSVQRVVRNADSTTLLPGHIVAWSEFSPIDVVRTNEASSVWTAGVIDTTIAPGGFGLMTEYGVGRVKINLTRGPGARFGTSTQAGIATEQPFNYVATLLESGASGDVVRAWIDTTRLRDPMITMIRSVDEQTSLTTFNYVNGLSRTFFLRHGGRVKISARGLAYYTGAVGPVVEFAAAIDAQEERIFISGNPNNDYRGVFYAEHTFDNIAAGQHTAGLKWRVNSGGNTGYLRGSAFATVVQILVL